MNASLRRPNYDGWTRKKVQVTDLFLDPENIRLQVDVTSQEALINDLVLNEDALQILESIVTNGLFPDETMVAVREAGKLIVIDGNRRAAALKVWIRPEITPTKQAEIRSLTRNAGPKINEVELVEAPNREDVQHFLASKHTLQTRRPWRPLRQAYFYKAELARGKTVQDLKEEYPNVDIVKFLRMINIHHIAKSLQYESEVTTTKVQNERSFPLSTIERLYESKQAREFFGFDFDKDGEVKLQIDKKEFEKGFKKVVQDAVDKVIDTRVLGDDDKIKSYLDGFLKTEIPDKSKKSEVTTSKDFVEHPAEKLKKRTKLAPLDMPFTLQLPGVRRMLNELQEIDYRRFPNASHDLLRSFLECSLKGYFDHISEKVTLGRDGYVSLDTVLKQFKIKMDSIGETGLSSITQKIISNENMMGYTAEFLNATNHSPEIFASDNDVEVAWDTMEPVFRYILDPKTKVT